MGYSFPSQDRQASIAREIKMGDYCLMSDLYEKIIEILESLPSEHEIWKDDNIEQLIDEMSRIKLEKEIK